MPDVRIHDDVATGQVQVRIHFHDGVGGWALASIFPYGADKAAALDAAERSAEEASGRLRLPWNRDGGPPDLAADAASGSAPG